jgi:L-lactate dehydrogenase (cytochrome)
MDLDLAYPAISDLRARARRRIPHFAWEYLDSAAGDESARARAEAALDEVRLMTHVLRGDIAADLSVRLMGRTYPLPFGIAPVGMSGLIWPDAERHLARLAARTGIPYGLSTVAAATPEEIGPHAGDQGWFQLYPARDPDIRRDLLRRARAAGFHTLVVTADVPAASRRERQRRARLSNPMRITARVLLDAMRRPEWALGQAARGIPRLKTLEPYAQGESGRARPSTAHIGFLLRCAPDPDYIRACKADWQGPVLVKGVLNANDARSAVEAGADGVWVSNHGGRQFDGGPAPIAQLPQIRAALGPEVPVIYDSGLRSGLDILRALALGADFAMLGRAFHYGLAALGPRGAAHVVHILKAQLEADMAQLGCTGLVDLPRHLVATEGLGAASAPPLPQTAARRHAAT